MLTASLLQLTQEVFINVARGIYSDGNFNWGRVAALFYFACRLVIKAIQTNIQSIFRAIFNWTLDYLREHVINWIREQGGWEGICSYLSENLTWQRVGVFLVGFLASVLALHKRISQCIRGFTS